MMEEKIEIIVPAKPIISENSEKPLKLLSGYGLYSEDPEKYDNVKASNKAELTKIIYRKRLEIDIDSNDKVSKTLHVILMNPSATYKHKMDNTIKNVLLIADSQGYNKVVILNILPLIEPKGNIIVRKRKDQQESIISKNYSEHELYIEKNKQYIIDEINKHAKNCLIAWGGDFNEYKGLNEKLFDIKEKIKEGIKDKVLKINHFVIKINTDGYPRHPSNWANTDGRIKQITIEGQQLESFSDIEWEKF